MEQVAAELNTSADSLTLMVRSPALFMTPDYRPVVLFRYSNSTYVYRGGLLRFGEASASTSAHSNVQKWGRR